MNHSDCYVQTTTLADLISSNKGLGKRGVKESCITYEEMTKSTSINKIITKKGDGAPSNSIGG